MDIYQLLGYIASALTTIHYVIAVFTLCLIAHCFLGYTVEITRKKVAFSIISIIIVQAGYYIIEAIYEASLPKEVVQGVLEGNINDPRVVAFYEHSGFMSKAVNGAMYVAAFLFFFMVYKNRKLIRAIESTVCLYGYYFYVNKAIVYSYIFLRGGKSSIFDEIYRITTEKTYVHMFIIELTSFTIAVIILMILYLGYYKKDKLYVVRIRDRIAVVSWFVLTSFWIEKVFANTDLPIEKRYELLSVLGGFMIPILAMFVPFYIITKTADMAIKEKNVMQETYLQAELEYIKQYKKAQVDTNAFRHDIINNLSLMKMMMESGKEEEASKYLDTLIGDIKALSPEYNTGDEMLDCIVAMKVDKMKEENIKFSLDGAIEGGLNMKPMDICNVFANATDNAIEAAKMVENDTWIKMIIKRTDNFCIVKLANAVADKVDVETIFENTGYTSKEDDIHHGFGLKSIKNTVKKYDGIIKAESNDKEYVLSIMIPR
ncbi:sensor histidine kinase [uncultured Eubacterium sp.]|uniref:sensor histidine kinase n=1 Tax=uncultured Eubacterium sp. TaxID=165185 RepID=UPI0025925E7D|nr:ATP-binding protein [uncultured Eubacterium sp.]